MLGVSSVLLRACSFPKPPSSPLVSLWSFDETSGAGTTFVDEGQADVPMTKVGNWADLTTASLIQGIGGTSAYTNGAGYATMPANQAAHNLAALTISFYFQRNSAAAKQILLAAGDGSEVGDFSIEVLADGRLRAWHTGQDARLRFFEHSSGVTGTNLRVGTAHRIDLTLGPQGARLFLDGIELAAAAITANVNGWNNARKKYLGRWTDGVSGPADGAFDRLQLWNRQLSSADILLLETAQSTILPGQPLDTFPEPYSGPIISVPSQSSIYKRRNETDNTLFDARNSTIIVDPERNRYCLDLVSGNHGMFLYGGKFGLEEEFVDVEWSDFYHGQYGINHQAVLMGPGNDDIDSAGDGVTIEAVRFDNTWDGIKLVKTEDWVIRGCYFTHIHDDAIENDNFSGGTIEDCLVDGAYVFYSCRSGGFYGNPATKLVTVKESIVRLKPFEIDIGASSPQGVGGLFKIHGGYSESDSGIGNHVPLLIRDCIFLIEDFRYIEGAGFSGQDKLGIPYFWGGLDPDSTGNTIIWTGGGAFPGDVPPSGFTVISDRSVFENARAGWLANHPWVDQTPSLGDD